MRTIDRLPVATLVLAISLAITACAPGVNVRGDWEAGQRAGPFGSILVVGVSPDFNQRCAFEHSLVSSLRSPTVTAVAACDYIGSKEPLSRAGVERAAAESGASAVVATLLVARSLGGEEGGSSDTRGAGYYKPIGYGFDTGYYGVYGIPVVYGEFETAPTVTVVRGSVTLATNVFDARSAAHVYGITTEARGLESRGQALAQIAPDIADHLKRAGVVR